MGLFLPASRVVLHGDAGPVVEGVGEAIVAGLAAHDGAALSGSLGHRRDPCQTSQGWRSMALRKRMNSWCL